MKITVGFQSTEGGRFYEAEVDSGDAIGVIGEEKWNRLGPFKQALALGVVGDMMACSYARANHLMVLDFDARMNELQAQLRALVSDG